MNSLWPLAFLIAVAPCLLILGYKISKRNERRNGKPSADTGETYGGVRQEPPAVAVEPPQSIQEPELPLLGALPKAFDIFDESTWFYATTNKFFWNGISLPDNTFLGGKTELDVTNFIGGYIKVAYESDDLNPGILSIGKNAAIVFLLEKLLQGVPIETLTRDYFEHLRHAGQRKKDFSFVVDDIKPITEIQPKIYAMFKNSSLNKQRECAKFDILTPDTWEFASDNPFVWNGKPVHVKDGSPETEQGVMNFFRSIFTLLEKNGDVIPLEKKVAAIKKKLDAIVSVQNDLSIDKERLQERDGRFNPRDPETYQYATNNPLIIDGIAIYDEYIDRSIGNKKIRGSITEKRFVIDCKMQGKADAWSKAVEKAREEYREKGVENPNDQTEWYKDRINELYKHFSKTSGNIDRKKIESYIDTLLSRCAPMPKKMKTVGGYGFTAAQLEILGEIADGELAAIGKVMSGGLYGGKLEQALFNSCGSLNRDWHFLAALHGKNKNTEEEKRVMREYFLYDNGRFETEEEVHQFFDSSEYLKLRPRLKKEMVEDALYWINGGSNEKN